MKDIKEGYKNFKNFFNFFILVEINGIAEDEHSKAIKLIKLSLPQNLKSNKASLVKCGATKVN